MTIRFTDCSEYTNWVKGFADEYKFCAKLYDDNSEFGINGGRVSKLEISKCDAQGRSMWIVNYDRGWDVAPQTKADEKVVKDVLKFLEKAPRRFST